MIVLAMTLALLPINPPHASGDVPSVPGTQPVLAPSPAPRVPTVSAHHGALNASVEAQGYFEPVDPLEIRIRPKAYSGDLTITSVVPNGAKVKKGDVVLQIDPVTIDKQLLAAENEVTASHATLTKAQADAKLGAAQDELSLKVQTEATQRAQDEVKWFADVDGPNILLEADQVVKNVKANVDDQQDELNELKKMYKTDDLTTDTADIVVKRAVRNLENTKIALKIQTEMADKTKKEVYPARKLQVEEAAKQAEYQLEQLQTAQAQSKVLRETGLVTALAATKAADEHLADLKKDKEKLIVVAPEDGVVLYGQLTNGGFQGADERSFRTGEKITPNQVVMTFYTPGKLRLHVDLAEAKFFQIRPSSKATMSPVAFPHEKLEGKTDRSPAQPIVTQQGPQYVLTVECAKQDKKLAPGMRANLQVEAPGTETAILVPTTAVADGKVWIQTDEGVEKRAVVVGKSDGKHTEIKQGLSDGDQVLVEAQK